VRAPSIASQLGVLEELARCAFTLGTRHEALIPRSGRHQPGNGVDESSGCHLSTLLAQMQITGLNDCLSLT
jgi:hypothetical protein